MLQRRLDLTAVLPDLGGWHVHAQRGVDLSLGRSRDALAVVDPEHAVLVHLQPRPLGEFADVDVVLPGAGEVLERRAVLGGFHDPDVDLQSRGRLHARLGLPRRDDARHARQGARRFHDGSRVVAGDDDVDVADRLLSPA